MAADVTVAVPEADPHTIEAYARELVGKPATSRVLALAADPRYDGPAWVHVDGVEVAVRGCVSSLAVREVLADLPPDGYAIVLTDRPTDDLGDALVSRFRRQRIEPWDSWATVPGLFGARHVEPGLRHAMPWLPRLLLDRLPPHGYPPSPTDLVTRDHVLGAITAQVLGIAADEVGLAMLLDRLGDMGVRTAWAALDDEPRDAIAIWADERAGAAAGDTLRLAAAPSTAHIRVLALGLMLDVLYGTTSPGPEVVEARRSWENGYRLPRVAAIAAAQIGAAARTRLRLLADTDPAARDDVWLDAQEAFAVASFPTGAAWSPSHPDGYRARLSAVASALQAALAEPDTPLAQLEAASTHLAEHDLAWTDRRADTERVEMAVRLVRWLRSSPQPDPTTLAGALARQAQHDGWVDWALSDVWSGSTHPNVAAAFQTLCARVLEARREHDEVFAALLAEQTAREVLDADVLAVENVLAQVLEPLSRWAPVMLVVVDGMSAAVASAVAEGINRLAWTEHIPAVSAGTPGRAAVLAALPTLTRFSRTSLLCGTLRDGTLVDEKREFSRIVHGPLFHKDDLRTPAGAAVNPEVDAAVASSVRVVGVVLNTVDDTLAKHDPDGTRWSVTTIQHLEPLLELARRSGRCVMLLSDHGHVVERGGRADIRALAEARWRPASTGPAGPGEVLLAGPRVLAGGGAIVAPWVEDLRYGRKAAGYHGGAAAAEVTIPMLVFAGRDIDLTTAGWVPAGDLAPPWWELAAAAPAPATPVPTKPTRRRRQPVEPPAASSDALFEVTPAEIAATPLDSDDALVTAFLSSPTYQRARATAGRAALPDTAVSGVLRLLLTGGGRASAEHVARSLGMPAARLPWAMSGLRRLLNVEGYPVVSMDADGRTVLLDVPLWRQQFGLAP